MYLHSCSDCGLADVCLADGLDTLELPKLEEIVNATTPKQKGEIVVRQGDRFKGLYAIKSGMCKSYRIDENGVEFIQAFHLPGELVGLEAIYPHEYGFTVEALDTLVVCELKFDDLQELCRDIPSLQAQLFRTLSHSLYQAYINPIDHFDQSTTQKLSGFIYDLWLRLNERGYTGNTFRLPMARRDIANHLGLTPETISRVLRLLQKAGVLEIQNRLVRILDLELLRGQLHCHAMEKAKVA